MSRSVPILALGLVFAFSGIALFAFTMRQREKLDGTAPKRKSDERDLAVERQNNAKMRIAGGVLAGFGAALVVVSAL
jgi:uncharacterized protein YjeT (DUF2065 family)